MPDTQRNRDAIINLFPDNTSGQCSQQDQRDFIVSVYGTLFRNAATVTSSPYNLTTNDTVLIVDATAESIVVNLPAKADYTHRFFVIVRVDGSGNDVDITPNGSETILGANTPFQLTSQWQVVWLYCADVAASDWLVLAQS